MPTLQLFISSAKKSSFPETIFDLEKTYGQNNVHATIQFETSGVIKLDVKQTAFTCQTNSTDLQTTPHSAN